MSRMRNSLPRFAEGEGRTVGSALRGVPDGGMGASTRIPGTPQRAFPTDVCKGAFRDPRLPPWAKVFRRSRGYSARSIVAALLGVLATTFLAAAVRADPAGDFDALKKQFDEQYDADKYRQAEQTAIQLRRLAEGPLSEKPQRAGTALYSQGIAVYHQGRYNEAGPLLEKALTIREKALGRESPAVARVLYYLGRVRDDQGRPKDAERLLRRSLAIREKAFGPQSLDVAFCANTLAILLHDQGNYVEAEQLYKRSLAIREKLLGPNDLDLAISLNNMGCMLTDQGRYAEAEKTLKRALSIREKALEPEHLDVATSLNNLAEVYRMQARYREAEPLYLRSLAIREKALGPDDLKVAWSLNNLALVYHDQGRYAEVERLHKRALAIKEKKLGPNHPDVASSLNNLATFYHDLGRYAESEAFHKRVLAIREKALGPEHPDLASSLHNLATLYKDLGRFAEAEVLYKRALAIKERSLGPDHPGVADTLNNLSNLYKNQGHFAEAEASFKRALAVREKSLGPRHPEVAQTINNLAILYDAQHRYAEAEPLYKKSLAIREESLGPEHPDVAASLNNLATLYDTLGRYAEAEVLYKRCLAIREKVLGPNHPDVAGCLNNLALLYQYQGRYADAEPLYQRAKAIKEKNLGPEHPEMATAFYNLAYLREDQKRDAEAEPLVDRAIAIIERAHTDPDLQLKCYRLRAGLSWRGGRRAEAVADLRRAMDLAEFQRGQSSGSERERAEFFGSFSRVFEQMVAWQAELGDLNEVLSAMERGRARSLLDEMNAGGADLEIGRSAVERQALRQRETELKSRIAELEKKLDRAAKLPDAEKQRLEAGMASAREALYQHYREQRSTNPVYRNLLSVGSGAPRLSQLQRSLVGADGLLLVYLFGREGGYLLVIGPKEGRLVTLKLQPRAAEVLGADAGPLTASRLRAVLSGKELPNKEKGSLLAQLANPVAAKAATEKLALLWEVLVPEPERQALTGGKVKRLILVPDGPLALLPFEALVVKPGQRPTYFLDVGPPILYGPSATVIYNLKERAAGPKSHEARPVLSVGDPAYPTGKKGAASGAAGRYWSADAVVTRLPYTAWESAWVADAFNKHGQAAEQLLGDKATKANLREKIPGRRVVHLACHGLADQSYGNLFGALALAPGPKAASNPGDDGFLTLAEIYELDLKQCELAILSACQTNFGPQQQGEGVWALSRGFLVAGSRRVVASNWLVDDEAAASLVSQFCAGVAQAQEGGGAVDYAQALRDAKRWVRQQDKWSSPFYWGTFVLVGAN